MFMKNLSYIVLLVLLLSCSGHQKPVADTDFVIEETDKLSKTDIVAEENRDNVSLKYKLEEHAVNLQLDNAEIKEVKVSEANLIQLKKWWDSLPQPLQNKIKAQEVEIELVTNVQSVVKTELTPEITDSRIENTGAALEKIIGESTGMTFTVKTSEVETSSALSSSASTSIIPYIKLPTKLSQFSSSLSVSRSGISAQNIHSIQFWWNNLPDDLKMMIQNADVIVELNCIALDKGVEFRKNIRLGENSDNYLYLMNEYLQNMIGHKQISNKKIPMGLIKTNSQIEKVLGEDSADYIFRIHLKNNKQVSDKPSA
jgi:hypothetical protein